jgi:hypothetical protein
MLTKAEVRHLQRVSNDFTSHFLTDVNPIRVDGLVGPSTRKRLKHDKYYLGYSVRAIRQGGAGHMLVARLEHPLRRIHVTHHGLAFSGPQRQRLAHNRRHIQHQHALRDRAYAAAHHNHGVGIFDGVPCANWLIPYLVWARAHGWDGRLVSGWRSKTYSTHLCYGMCGRPSCSGTCAGASSRHVGQDKPDGAIDVTFYWQFASIIAHCPYSPRIWNGLSRDRVHFSAYGN